MFVAIIAIIIFLSIFILIHELGHFWAAKRFGLWVEEFGFGLPPRIWGKKIGDTIYSINALPFGGFVKIFGENREDEDEVIPESKEEISIIRIEENVSDSGNQLLIDENLVAEKISISNVKKGFNSITIGRRALIIFAGVLMNFLLGWLIISLIFSIGIPQSVLITEVKKNSPAVEAGLITSDRIIGFERVEEFINYVNQHQGKEIILKIERSGKTLEIKAVPRLNPPSGEGALGIGLIETGMPKQNLLASVWEGLKSSIEIIQAVFVALFNLIIKVFVGQANLEQIIGPVGIVKLTSQVGKFGIIYLLQLFAFISLNLVVINIFPFPALDGGRLLFLLIEKIKGSPLPVKFERYANAIGMALLLFLMVIITIKDITRIF